MTVFGQKRPIFEFFPKIRLEHFFTLPKPYLTAKFQKKVMNGCLDICVTDSHTYIRTYAHTYKGQLIGLPAARPKIEVISLKPSKNWIFGKKWQFLTLFGQKYPQFRIFPWVPLLTHSSKQLGEDFRKFSAKTNDKN